MTARLRIPKSDYLFLNNFGNPGKGEHHFLLPGIHSLQGTVRNPLVQVSGRGLIVS